MAKIFTSHKETGVKLYTVPDGDIVTCSGNEGVIRLTYMVMGTPGRRSDRYVDQINVVNLMNGLPGLLHGSQRVIHHRGAAVVLDYVEGA